MSATSTPTSEPAPPPRRGGDAPTPVVPDSVNDMFNLAAPPVEAPVVGRLVPVTPGAFAAIPLHQDQGTVTLGRSKELPLPFRVDNVPKLSGRHCDLTLHPITLRVTLTDTSANGTFINGERAPKGVPVPLHAGDTVSLTKPSASPSGLTKAVAATRAGGSDVEQIDYVFQRLKEETDVKAMVDELTCGICMSIYHRPVSLLPCMHVFCAPCISQWLREGKKACAECRQSIREVRPTHKIQSCVELLLLADPSRRRPAEEVRRLEALDDIPPAGKSLWKRGPEHRHNSASEEDDGSDDDDDDDGSDDDDGVPPPARLLAAGVSYAAVAAGLRPGSPQSSCPQCDHPSTFPDRFQCVPQGPHLTCHGCRRRFPERPLCGRPQRCHLCSAPYCGLYFSGEAVRTAEGQPSYMPKGCGAEATDSPEGRLLCPVGDLHFTSLPAQTFGGNTTETSILTTFLATKQILVEAVWATCLAKLREGAWTPDLPCVNGEVTADSPVCRPCAARVFAALVFHYRRAIPSSELPESVTKRSNCWYGKECRTQFHKPQHAQGFNHVCYQQKRKE